MSTTTKALKDIRRGDRIASPKGTVLVVQFYDDFREDFRASAIGKPTKTTIEGILNGKRVRLTGISTSTVEVEA